MLTRREMLAGSAGLVAAASAPMALADATALPRPRIFGAGPAPALDAYKRAVGEMLKLPKTDPRNWYRQALIHVMDCPHGNWWFLPWHRGYLARFEAICGQLIGDPGFRLPYWDYTEDPSIPAAFWEAGLDPTRSPFDQDRTMLISELADAVSAWWPGLDSSARDDLAKKGLTSGNSVTAEADRHWGWASGPRRPSKEVPSLDPATRSMITKEKLAGVMRPRSFTSFASGRADHHSEDVASGLLETGPHNNVHGGTGGFMGAFMSPVDPIFWLHHANIDRLWDIWSRSKNFVNFTGLPATTPQEMNIKEGFEKQTFRFFHAADGASVQMSTLQCLSPSALGYTYEPGSMSDVAAPAAPGIGPAFLSNLGTAPANLNRLFRKGMESSAAVSVEQEALVKALENPVQEPIAQITVTPPKDAQLARIRVYLNCPYLSRFTPIDDPHYVGTLSFFGSLHHANHGNSTTATLSLGPTLDRLRSEGKLPKSALRVQLIPETREGDDPLSGGELAQVSIAIS